MEGRRFSGNRGNFRGPRRDFGPREMHNAVCSECKKECQVPFKPKEDRPVLCKDCYIKKKRAEEGGFAGSARSEEKQESEESEQSEAA